MNKKRLWKRWMAFILAVCIWITNSGICSAKELGDSIVQPQEEILEEEDTLEYEVESEHLDISEEIEEKTEEEIEIPEILEEPEEIETPVEPIITDEHTESLDELLISESGLNIEEESLEGIITVSAVKAQTYTGKALTPTIIVKDAKTKKTLKKGMHYTVSYEDNINAGQAEILITGNSDYGYKGMFRVCFEILPRAITKASAKIKGSPFYYAADEVCPTVCLVYNKQELKENIDYKLTYSNNIFPGNAQILVEGIGNYEGARTLKYKISARPLKTLDVILSNDSNVWDAEIPRPEILVTYKDDSEKACEEGTDYTVVYPKEFKIGKNTITVTGRGCYNGSVKKTFTVTKKKISLAEVSFSYLWEYTKKNLSVYPSRVMIGDTELVRKKDYTVKYLAANGKISTSVKNIGRYKMILTGTGNYQGSCEFDFCIVENIADYEKSLNSSVHLPVDGNQFVLDQCSVSACVRDEESLAFSLALHAGRNEFLENLSEDFYIAVLNSAGTMIQDAIPAMVTLEEETFTVEADILAHADEGALTESVMKQYAVAVASGEGYQLVSDTSHIQNPEELSAAKKDTYKGYYDDDDISSKKGIQGTDFADTHDLKVQHVLLNLDLAEVVGTSASGGYQTYTYNGKEYYFKDILGDTIYSLNGWGNDNPYGSHRRSVTVVFLLGWKDELSYLIHSSARKKGAAPYYALNMQEEKARETFEALFCWMGEQYADHYKYRICNWTLGNEVNSCKAWNYSGSMSLEACVENYAQAFLLLYQGVRSAARSPRLFISLDHCWNASAAGHSGKAYLDAFAKHLNETAPWVEWNVNYHAYSQPLTRTTFWRDTSNTKNSASTKYISMKNVRVLTDYLADMEEKYNKPEGSIRVILGEHGYTAVLGKITEERAQAAALGYGYYIAMFNDRIDAYIIRAYLDDLEETRSGLYLGLTGYKNGQQIRKESYGIYKRIDTKDSLEYMQTYLSLIGYSSWEDAIEGFDANRLAADPEY